MVGLAPTNDTTHSTLYSCMHTFISYIHICAHTHTGGWASNQPTYLSLTCSIPPGCRGCAGNRQSETCRSRTTPARMHIVDAVDVSHPNTQSAMHAAFTPPHPTMAFLSSFSVISTGTILPSCTAHPTPQPSHHTTMHSIPIPLLHLHQRHCQHNTTAHYRLINNQPTTPHHLDVLVDELSVFGVGVLALGAKAVPSRNMRET